MQDIPFLDALLRDTLAGTTWIIAFSLAMMSITLLKKSHGRFSTTTGLAIYFLSFLFFTVSADLSFLYRYYLQIVFLDSNLPEVIGGAIWVLGINVFIYVVDTEMMFAGGGHRRVTILSMIYTVSFVPLIMLGVEAYFIFVGLAVALIYMSRQYLRALLQLEITRRKFPQLLFVLAFNLSGFGNFFMLFDYTYSTFLLKNAFILAGILVLMRVWNELPTAEDLDWLLTLDRLIVLEHESSVPLVDFRFRAASPGTNNGSDAVENNGALVAGAVGGIDRLMDEILADADGLGEIVHGKKTVMFLRRERFTCMLVVDKSMEETRYRMETFAMSFEKRYREELAAFSGDVAAFSKAESLVREAFL